MKKINPCDCCGEDMPDRHHNAKRCWRCIGLITEQVAKMMPQVRKDAFNIIQYQFLPEPRIGGLDIAKEANKRFGRK